MRCVGFFSPPRWSHCIVCPWCGFIRKWKFNKRHYLSEVRSWLHLCFLFGMGDTQAGRTWLYTSDKLIVHAEWISLVWLATSRLWYLLVPVWTENSAAFSQQPCIVGLWQYPLPFVWEVELEKVFYTVCPILAYLTVFRKRTYSSSDF